ncbi:hypothetical protein CENSYa_1393 [Cenarchaeum symbiosum A]|uniref:Uncharacterized protein n=1 Tax=Cenarchaeum symbiosum (strain A) TaxID=414004 RepID=A0RXE9_CENSY|nr:hypothetical protein CENSYa_1393 [Cenarchaeum symbiosum A]
MEFHPSQVPVAKTFEIGDVESAALAAEEMVEMGFEGRKDGFKVLMPKEKRLAKRIGYAVTTGVTAGLGRTGQKRDIRYWTYHEDDEHYAIVLVGAGVFNELGL